MRSRSPLRTSLSKRRSALAKHLPKALTGDSHAVHQARVASRRLRETLPVVGADLDDAKGGKDAKGAKKIRRRMRRLTRALGPVRELEVTLGMVAPPPAEAAASSDGQSTDTGKAAANESAKRSVERDAARAREKDPTARGREHVAAMLRRDLEKARERLMTEIDADKVQDWLGEMEALEHAIDPDDPPAAADAGRAAARSAKGATPAAAAAGTSRSSSRVRARRAAPVKWRRELSDRLETRAANLSKALDEAGVLFDSERLHQVRIALKRLRYAMELAGELRVAPTGAAVRDLKAVQDTLGTLHDHDVLMEYTASAATQPGLTRPTRASLTALHRSFDTVRHQLHAQFLAARPSLERVHARALAVAARARASR
jgi:CHAD domain-containing protein